jgi:uncharacterized protein YybS (DUF2232 family)
MWLLSVDKFERGRVWEQTTQREQTYRNHQVPIVDRFLEKSFKQSLVFYLVYVVCHSLDIKEVIYNIYFNMLYVILYNMGW